MSSTDDSKLSIIHIAQLIDDDDTKLNYCLHNLRMIEKEVAKEHRAKLCKSLAGAIIRKFSHLAIFQSDVRALEIWECLARHSASMGYENVMERIRSNGYFADLPEFYEKWASYLYENKSAFKFSEVRRLAEQNCSDKARIREFFSGFSDLSVEETENFIDTVPKKVTQKESRMPVSKQPLSVVNEESYEKSGGSVGSGAKDATQGSTHSSKKPSDGISDDDVPVKSKAVDADVGIGSNKQDLSMSPPVATHVSSHFPPAYHSFTTHLKKSEADLFGETLPFSQEPQSAPSPVHIAPAKDFSIFNDAEETNDNRGIVRSHMKDFLGDSPVTKRQRNSPMNSTFVVSAEPGDKVATIPKDVLDEKTIAGKHLKGDASASTPTGKSFEKPKFEVSPTQNFGLRKSRGFDFGPAVGPVPAFTVKKEPQPIVESLKMMTLQQSDDLETTRDMTICADATITSSVNPWGEKERLDVLKRAPVMVEQHEFLTVKCPMLRTNATINMGGEYFRILGLIGQGGFAKVYKAETDEKKVVAVKLEMPPCPWEVYICKSVMARIDPKMFGFVMQVKDAYIFSNASAIVYEYHPKNNLLDFSNACKKSHGLIDGQIVALIASQIAEILRYVHKAQIIHSDVKPDNFLICDLLTDDEPILQFDKPFVKLIDWGRGIDMVNFPNQTFSGRAGTESFDCVEMDEGRPWTYQPDFFGFVGTLHVLIFGSYMKYYYNAREQSYLCKESFKVRYPLSDVLKSTFKKCLNIPDCESFPNWADIVKELRTQLQEYALEDIVQWRRAIRKVNDVLKAK